MYVGACACIMGIAIELKKAWTPIIYLLNIQAYVHVSLVYLIV